MKRRLAIKTDLFAAERHREKIDDFCSSRPGIERHMVLQRCRSASSNLPARRAATISDGDDGIQLRIVTA